MVRTLFDCGDIGYRLRTETSFSPITYFDVTGTTEFDLNVFEGAMSPSAVARINPDGLLVGDAMHSPVGHRHAETDLRVAEIAIDDESDTRTPGDDPEKPVTEAQFERGGTHKGKSNGQNELAAGGSPFRSAVADSTSSRSSDGTSFASASDNHLSFQRTVSENDQPVPS